PGFTANLRTLDIDFLIKNMRRPVKSVNITSLAKEAGYTIDHDVMEGITKIYTQDLMEIEFIIEQKGKGDNPVIKTNLGVNAQALRHLSSLTNNSILIELFGFSITVPSPEAYVIHKIVINKDRGIKSEKDIQAIISLLPFIDKEKFKEIFDHLTKKEQQEINNFMANKNTRWDGI
ncbi:MAG: hypothetical protein JJE17_11280, partial [Peptostreptococcaceae bacterium]|nr:hypothetical protein [Peptostreptococcaceae bacterium]